MADAGEEKRIISDRQARGMLDLMHAFYSDPKNRAAYNQWKAARERAHTAK